MDFAAPRRPVERVFLHCSASDHPAHDDVEVMRGWHVNGNGWSDVGYHFFVRKDGALQAGRDLEQSPAAQTGHNLGTLAICLHGLEEELFTQAQLETLVGLCKEIRAAYDDQVTFHGHCEVSSKACPVFDYRRVLGLGPNGAMQTPTTTDLAMPELQHLASRRPVLERTARGDSVVVLQGLLNRKGHPVIEDGIFGRATFEAVLAFQRANGLVVDGVAGPATWGALAT